MCLYGFPNETWAVDLPVEEVPPVLPEPALGINFARHAMNGKDWLSFVAAHSDSWLLSVAFYYGATSGFDQESRKRLFSMINGVPTIFEVVTGTDKSSRKKQLEKTTLRLARQLEPNPKSSKIALPEDKEASDGDEEEPREHDASCGRKRKHESTLHHAGGGIMWAAGPGAVSCTCTPEFVFQDFRARQQGLLKAFTTELDRFYSMCDPEKKNLCLYGLANETWEVDLPVEKLPSDLPEPALGINFSREGMNNKDWLSLVAMHSDSWLLSVAFYYGARFGLDKESRTRLFSMINSVPITFEVVTGTVKRQPKEKSRKNGSKSNKSTWKRAPNPRSSKIPLSEDKEDHESTLCGETRLALDLLRLV